MKYEGYVEERLLPIKQGDVVVIKKGTILRSTHPRHRGETFKAKRTYRVKVNHLICGMSGKNNPTVNWAGTGGYWVWADINDVI